MVVPVYFILEFVEKEFRHRDILFQDCDILHGYDVSDRQGAISLICLDGTS